MRLYFYSFVALIRKFILRQNTGQVICDFAQKMGTVYIKVAQILAMQNLGNVFTETDRERLIDICDHCNPIPFSKVQEILELEYECPLAEMFRYIDPHPLGSASISQVHRAVLQDGRVVAVKVKRRDVVRRVNRDIRQIKKIIRRFGHFAKLRNFIGSERALEYYTDWIYQETDFASEQENIVRYHEFAESVNGKVEGTKRIVVPKVYRNLSTDNVIVMEYIDCPTVNQLSLTPENKTRISEAVNSYLRLSFYALLNGLPVVFHGDPHGGNIYLDATGNVGFLDMGLIFEFDGEDSKFIQDLFIYSYMNKPDELLDILLERCEYQTVDREVLLTEIKRELKKLHHIPVSQFFVEMIGIFTQHNVAPPVILFQMAKAFVALFGINNVIANHVDADQLLASQITEFYVRRAADGIQKALWGWGAVFAELASRIWSGELTVPTLEDLISSDFELGDIL